MTDRELWVKTCKTVGAMTGGTVVLLGAMSLLLVLVVGRPAASSPEAPSSPSSPVTAPGGVGKIDTAATPPPVRVPRRRGVIPDGRAGEAI